MLLFLLWMLLPPAPSNAPIPNYAPANVVVKKKQMENEEVEIV